MYWKAAVDGMDIGFVLGSATTVKEALYRLNNVKAPEQKAERINLKRRSLHLWMLDFNKSSKIKFTITDVKMKLVPAFRGNGPCHANITVDEDLWGGFLRSVSQG